MFYDVFLYFCNMDKTTDCKILWNYQNVCRTCLSETDELLSIFINSKSQSKTYAEMIMACTSLQILQTDEVSLKICPICIHEIEQSYLFYKKCQEADFVLQNSHKFYITSQIESDSLKNNIIQSTYVDSVSYQTINEEIKCDDFEEEIEEENNESNNDISTINFDCAFVSSDILTFENDHTSKLTNKDLKFEEQIEDECNMSDNGLSTSKFDCIIFQSSDISTKESIQINQNLDKKVTWSLKKNEKNKIVQCKFCLKTYISELSLEKHTDIHSKQTHECYECGLKYSTSLSLNQHKKFHLDGKKMRICNICNLNFATIQHLNLHKVMHVNKPKFICDECGQVLSSKASMNVHKSTHDGSLKHKCEICGVKLNKRSLTKHVLLHSNSKSNNCLSSDMLTSANEEIDEFINKNDNSKDFTEEIEDQCNKINVKTLSSILTKKKEKSQIDQNFEDKITSGWSMNEENEIVQCKFCLKSWISQLSLEKHMKYHLQQPYECHECGFKYSSLISLNRHKKIHVGNGKVYACDICNISFPTTRHLNFHKVMHLNKPKFICDECGQVISSKEGLNNHKSAHGGRIKRKCEICGLIIKRHKMVCCKRPEQTSTRKKLFKCSMCTKAFTSKQYLSYHSRSKHQTELKEDNVTQYNCRKCKRTFSLKYIFDRHMRAHAFTLKTSCKICNMNFETYGKLQEHRKSEHKLVSDKICQCQTCGKVISTPSGLKTHMLVHSNARPYKCSFCDKRFNQISHKYTHERLHTGEKPFTCVQCNKSFRHQYTLIEHNRLHTGETPYKCFICNKGFYRTGTLKKHLLTHE